MSARVASPWVGILGVGFGEMVVRFGALGRQGATLLLVLLAALLAGCTSSSPEQDYLESIRGMSGTLGPTVSNMTDKELLDIAVGICLFEAEYASTPIPDRINAELETLQELGLSLVAAGVVAQVATDTMCPRE